MNRPDHEFDDRRKHKRIPDSFPVMFRVRAPFAVSVQFGQRSLDAIARDISEGGVGLYAGHDLPAHSLVGLQFKIRNESAALEADRRRAFDIGGEVRYCAVTDEKCYRLGVLFTSIQEADRRFIAQYIKSQVLRPSTG